MWLFICASINCLPRNLLIDGKFTVTQHENEHTTRVDKKQESNIHTDVTVGSLDPEVYNESQSSSQAHKRVKRLHVFRPLFVYRQEKIERQRIIEQRKLRNRQFNNQKKDTNRRQDAKAGCNCDCDCNNFKQH